MDLTKAADLMDGKLRGEEVTGDIDYDGRLVVYIIKADETSYINYIKPLILAEELAIEYAISVIDTREDWFYKIHPERYVPAIKDKDPETGQEIIVFESTACLRYIGEQYGKDGYWTGRTAWEKAAITTWTEYQTAGLGPSAKYWLYFLKGYPTRQNPEPMPKTVKKLHENCLRQWDILNARLSEKDQDFIALRDRPTIADLSYLPFSMPSMFRFFGVDIDGWPSIKDWSQRMMQRTAVKKVLERGPKYGH